MRSRAPEQRESRRKTIATGFAVLVSLIALLSLPIAAERIPRERPRLANLFLKWHLSEEEARDLARWDVIILDMEVVRNTPEAFALLRSLAPEAKLLAYVTAQEIREDAAAHPQALLRRALASGVRDDWYLRATSGHRVSWWPQTWLLDVTNTGWTHALADFVQREIASDRRWDGVYYDNLWGSLSWFDRDAIDLDGDGLAEDPAALDRAWVAGVRSILVETRTRTRADFLITGNGSAVYADLADGLLLEHFPETNEGGWSASMRALLSIVERDAGSAFAIVNTNTNNTGFREDYARMRFGLTSALLGGGYYSFDFGDADHAQRWWYDEYEVSLGDPVSPPLRVDVAGASVVDEAFSRGVYRREYERGIVLVNATSVPRRVVFDEEFERLRGEQDPGTNTGAMVTEITLPPQDGAILLRPLVGVTSVAYANGAFARVFSGDGSVARNGFFTYDALAPGGATVEHRDLDGDGDLEIITADGAFVRVVDGGVVTASFAPFGERANSGLDFALDDLDRNGTWEIVVAQRDRGGRIGIFNLLEGRLLSPLLAPFGRLATHGVSVATARVAADARPNIIVGAGNGARPEVRVLDWTGRPTGTSFSAYGRNFRGGVRVAAGDLDHDGVDEIVTGAGPGGGPHVRVFTLDGTLLHQFFALDADRRDGVDVGVADLDGDGAEEILGMSTSVFTAVGE